MDFYSLYLTSTFNITACYIHANFLLNVAYKKKQITYVGLWDMHVHTSKIVQSYTQKLFAWNNSYSKQG